MSNRTDPVMAHGGTPEGVDRHALPRFLKTPLLYMERLAHDGYLPRRSLIIASAFSLAILGAGAAIIATPSGEAAVAALSVRFGFAIGEIRINGTHEIHREHVRAELGVDKDTPILNYDVHAARDRLYELSWVKSVSVSKVYPNTLAVDIVERQPFAVWQKEGKLYLIENDGEVIVPFEAKFKELPIVVGDGANRAAAEFLAEMTKYPELEDHIKAYVRVGDRRWNLDLDNGVTVMLPENDMAGALARFVELNDANKLVNRDLKTIDLRIDGKLVVRLGDDTLKARQDRTAEMEAKKKAENH